MATSSSVIAIARCATPTETVLRAAEHSEWPRCALMLSLGLLATCAAHAQQDAETLRAIDECSEIADRDARLDCIDAALAERNGPPAVAEPAPAVTAPRPSSRDPQPAAAAEPAAAPTPAAPEAEAQRPSRRERRAQQRAEEEAQVRAVTVVAVSVNPLGQSTFVTDDGEAWVSVQTPLRSYPEVPFAAEIEPGSIGSFFLRLPDRPRRLRVSLRE
jgi:hypothetical protein